MLSAIAAAFLCFRADFLLFAPVSAIATGVGAATCVGAATGVGAATCVGAPTDAGAAGFVADLEAGGCADSEPAISSAAATSEKRERFIVYSGG